MENSIYHHSNHNKIQFLIGAATSNSGKTTLTIGLLRALKRRGLQMQPFKCGPDYIDPQYHSMASGNTSVNLDTWMASRNHVKELFRYYSKEAEVSVVEGVMGLFDGFHKSEGSSADIARLLQIPVILVVNARSTAYSVAPVIYGFKHFDPSVRIGGVIFNQVGSENHARFLEEACQDAGVTYLGYLPRMKEIELPSRHLGLTLDALDNLNGFADRIADALEEYVNLDLLMEECSTDNDLQNSEKENSDYIGIPMDTGNIQVRKIAVAHDEAFNFAYRYNLEKLAATAPVSYFSPMKDSELPEADFVYLPGGYPEFFLQELSQNRKMMESIRAYVEKGGYLLAECGGMMYLCRQITGMDGTAYPMTDVLPLKATMKNMKLHLGYRTLECREHVFKGHEFHYSSTEHIEGEVLKSTGMQTDARGNVVSTELYRYKNAIAGYTHLYWGEHNIFNLFKE